MISPLRYVASLILIAGGFEWQSTTALIPHKIAFQRQDTISRRRHVEVSLLEKPGWLNDAMGAQFGEQQDSEGNYLERILPLRKGISGFAVDEKLGFVAVIASNIIEKQQQRFTFAVVSSKDKERLESAEALTMVQFAGGLDLGTAIVPPDALAKIVSEEVEISPEDLRHRISLLRVDVVPNENIIYNTVTRSVPLPAVIVPSIERDQAIQKSLPKVLAAVKGLPNLTGTSIEEVQSAMQIHADSGGTLDIQGFSELLETIRSNQRSNQISSVKFMLVVSVISDDSVTQLELEAPTAMALALSMRYKVNVEVSSECLLEDNEGAYDSLEILERFPAFRSMKELLEDAKMDGFTSMFQKEQLDNDQKM
jgi:hypothetical protein